MKVSSGSSIGRKDGGSSGSISALLPYPFRRALRNMIRLNQRVCSRPECQRRRRAEYHRQKIRTDSLYAPVVKDSRDKWRVEHGDSWMPNVTRRALAKVPGHVKVDLETQRPHPIALGQTRSGERIDRGRLKICPTKVK